MNTLINPIRNSIQTQRLILSGIAISLLLTASSFATAADATLSDNKKVCTMVCADGAERNGVIAGGQSWSQSGCQRAADAFCASHGGIAAGYPKLGGLAYAQARKEIYRESINTGSSPLPIVPAHTRKPSQ